MLILLACAYGSEAQLVITNEPNAAALAQKLVGDGVTIANVTFTGNSLMAGHFKNLGLTNIGIDTINAYCLQFVWLMFHNKICYRTATVLFIP